MDLNLVVLAGVAAGLPEVRNEDGGMRQLRFHMTVATSGGHISPTIPVHQWNPDQYTIDAIEKDALVWVAGELQMRRFQSSQHGGMIQVLEVYAHEVTVRELASTHTPV